MATGVNVNHEKCQLHVTDLGATLRRLFSAAAEGYTVNPQRKWTIVYKGVNVGYLQLKDTHLKGTKNARSSHSTGTSNGTTASADATRAHESHGKSVALDQQASECDHRGVVEHAESPAFEHLISSDEPVQTGHGGKTQKRKPAVGVRDQSSLERSVQGAGRSKAPQQPKVKKGEKPSNPSDGAGTVGTKAAADGGRGIDPHPEGNFPGSAERNVTSGTSDEGSA